jgi:phage host-nuclease inhibitor protein Gam
MAGTTMTIADWAQADAALAELAGLHRELLTLSTTRDKQIEHEREVFKASAMPLAEEAAAIEAALREFAAAHQGEMPGRSIGLVHGRVGFLRVSRLAIRNMKRAIDWLLANNHPEYLAVRHDVNKEALALAEPPILKACGAAVKSRDQFWYEADGVRHAVED